MESSTPDSLVCPNGYYIYRSDRDLDKTFKVRGGGIAVLIKNEIKSKLLSRYSQIFEKLFILIKCDDKNLTLCATYLPPYSNYSFYGSFLNDCELYQNLYNSYSIIIGDFNIRGYHYLNTEENLL